MADRLSAALSPFDVLVFTLAGAFVIAGAWWGIDGVPGESPSTAVVIGLVAASYLAGHLVAAVSGVLWTGVWGLIGSPFFAIFIRAFETDKASGAELRFRKAFQDTRDLRVKERVELIRTVLRQQQLDSRFDTMNTIAWVSQSLATAATTLAALFVVLVVIDGDVQRLLPAAAGMVAVAVAFAGRAYSYQRIAARTLMFDAVALVDPPMRMRQPEAERAASRATDSWRRRAARLLSSGLSGAPRT
jgi:hypothetical protein